MRKDVVDRTTNRYDTAVTVEGVSSGRATETPLATAAVTACDVQCCWIFDTYGEGLQQMA